MDEQVKARLIGATVLVVIAVALVPELLSGPRRAVEAEPAAEGSRGMRTITIDIGGGTAAGPSTTMQATPPSSAVGEGATVDAPGATAETPADSEPPAEESTAPDHGLPSATVATTAPVASPPSQDATPRPAPKTPVPAQAAAGGGWSVQIGAFGTAATAHKLVADLGRDGLPAYVAPLERGGKTLHRVRVGPVASKAEAEKLAARLKSKGLPGSVVAPD